MKNPSRGALFLMSVISMVGTTLGAGCSRVAGGGSAEPKSEDEKAIYTWGYMLGRNAGALNLSPHELDIVKTGMTDSANKKKAAVDIEKYGPQIDALARRRAESRAEVEKGKAAATLEQAAKEPGAEKLPSGLIFKQVRAGTGAQPAPGDRVKVHYEGRLADGEVFDSSRKRGEPIVISLDSVIPCWKEGVARMKIGEQAKLTCPSDIGYGPRGQPPVIPGNAVLIFDVELMDVVKPPAAPPVSDTPAPPPASGGPPPAAPKPKK
jgi:FKBP-type peptidyl-prolyl cis-trans isomerase FkpA